MTMSSSRTEDRADRKIVSCDIRVWSGRRPANESVRHARIPDGAGARSTSGRARRISLGTHDRLSETYKAHTAESGEPARARASCGFPGVAGPMLFSQPLRTNIFGGPAVPVPLTL
jgi:hypothetical protein